MRTTIKILAGVMTITVLMSLNLAMAQKEDTGVEVGPSSQNASLSVTPQEMKNMAGLLEEMANEIKSGNMTPQIQAESAEILVHVGHILDALANPDDNSTYSIKKQQNKEAEKKWNPWDEMVEH